MKVKLAVGALPGSGHPRASGLALEEIVACPGRIRQECDTIRFFVPAVLHQILPIPHLSCYLICSDSEVVCVARF